MSYRFIGNLDVLPDGKQVGVFLCDTAGDVSSIPTDNLASASVAVIADGHKYKLLDNTGAWKEGSGGGGGSAADTTYDNTTSGLVATNVQDAIDEVHEEAHDATSAIGDLGDLGTTAKNNLVAAINEVLSDVTVNESALATVIDTGAKNRLKITASSTTVGGVTVTINSTTGEITLNGTCDTSSTYTIADLSTLGLSTSIIYKICGELPDSSESSYILYSYSAEAGQWDNLTRNDKAYNPLWTNFRIRIYEGATFDNLVIKPMICSLDDYAISQKYVPYCPTLSELYAMVAALQ